MNETQINRQADGAGEGAECAPVEVAREVNSDVGTQMLNGREFANYVRDARSVYLQPSCMVLTPCIKLSRKERDEMVADIEKFHLDVRYTRYGSCVFIHTTGWRGTL